MKTNNIFPSTFAALLAATALFAVNENNGGTGAVTAADKNFMVAAAEGGMLEVRLGEVAEKKGASQEVKAFGAMMVSDHGKAGEDLKSVAAKHGIEVPGDLDAKHKAIVDRLAKLSGSAFDKAYIDEMLKDHMKDASAFQGVAKNAKDPDVKVFAQRTLPIIKAHLAKIKSMAGEHKSA
jgi:putative membrane protein